MAGLISRIGQSGNRLEYLAHYILAKLGSASPVPRPEDVGIDFYCSLGEEIESGTKVDFSFAVQLKSGKNRILELGGYTPGGTWKDYELKWFFDIETPLLFGVPDEKSKSLDLYVTSIARFSITSKKLPFKVVMEGPDEDSRIEDLHPPKKGRKLKKSSRKSDGSSWRFNLGPPVVSCSIVDLDDDQKLENFRTVLRLALAGERLNAIYRQLGIPYWTWLKRCTTNQSSERGYAYRIGIHKKEDMRILSELVPFIVALGLSYKKSGKKSELNKLKPISGLLPQKLIPENVRLELPMLFSKSPE